MQFLTSKTKSKELLQAGQRGDLRTIQTLLERKSVFERKADIDARNEHGETALMLAIRAGGSEMPSTVMALLKAGANPNLKGLAGDTPLMLAVSNEADVSVVTSLVQYGADVNAANNYGQTAIKEAVKRNGLTGKDDIETLQLLLNLGADINRSAVNVESPLMYASRVGLLNTTRFLIEHGADIEAVNSYGRTALDMAKNPEIKFWIRQALLSRAQVAVASPVDSIATEVANAVAALDRAALERIGAARSTEHLSRHLGAQDPDTRRFARDMMFQMDHGAFLDALRSRVLMIESQVADQSEPKIPGRLLFVENDELTTAAVLRDLLGSSYGGVAVLFYDFQMVQQELSLIEKLVASNSKRLSKSPFWFSGLLWEREINDIPESLSPSNLTDIVCTHVTNQEALEILLHRLSAKKRVSIYVVGLDPAEDLMNVFQSPNIRDAIGSGKGGITYAFSPTDRDIPAGLRWSLRQAHILRDVKAAGSLFMQCLKEVRDMKAVWQER